MNVVKGVRFSFYNDGLVTPGHDVFLVVGVSQMSPMWRVSHSGLGRGYVALCGLVSPWGVFSMVIVHFSSS